MGVGVGDDVLGRPNVQPAAEQIRTPVEVTLTYKNTVGDTKSETYPLNFYYYVEHVRELLRPDRDKQYSG
jgi:hypothetical protein